jgi:hypothetical protein
VFRRCGGSPATPTSRQRPFKKLASRFGRPPQYIHLSIWWGIGLIFLPRTGQLRSRGRPPTRLRIAQQSCGGAALGWRNSAPWFPASTGIWPSPTRHLQSAESTAPRARFRSSAGAGVTVRSAPAADEDRASRRPPTSRLLCDCEQVPCRRRPWARLRNSRSRRPPDLKGSRGPKAPQLGRRALRRRGHWNWLSRKGWSRRARVPTRPGTWKWRRKQSACRPGRAGIRGGLGIHRVARLGQYGPNVAHHAAGQNCRYAGKKQRERRDSNPRPPA